MESVMKPSHPYQLVIFVCVCVCVSLWFELLLKVIQLVVRTVRQPVLF